jgi:tetratricopeptide (TPR) repeat protein
MDLVQRARDLYSTGRMHDALEAAQAACDRAPKDPEAWRLLARVSRHIGLTAASDDAFRRAAALAPGRPVPYRVSADRFAELLQEARNSLPAEGRRRLESVTIRIQALPSVDEIRAGLDPDALTLRKRQPVDLLTFFQVNHENRSDTENALRTLLARSLSRG